MREINFLEAPAAVGHISDPRVEDAGYAGELVDDLIDEFVRDAPVLFHSTGIALTDPFFSRPSFSAAKQRLESAAHHDRRFRRLRRHVAKGLQQLSPTKVG